MNIACATKTGLMPIATGTLLKAPSGVVTKVSNIIITNTDAVPITVNIRYKPSRGTARCLFPVNTAIPVGKQAQEPFTLFMSPQDEIEGEVTSGLNTADFVISAVALG